MSKSFRAEKPSCKRARCFLRRKHGIRKWDDNPQSEQTVKHRNDNLNRCNRQIYDNKYSTAIGKLETRHDSELNWSFSWDDHNLTNLSYPGLSRNNLIDETKGKNSRLYLDEASTKNYPLTLASSNNFDSLSDLFGTMNLTTNATFDKHQSNVPLAQLLQAGNQYFCNCDSTFDPRQVPPRFMSMNMHGSLT